MDVIGHVASFMPYNLRTIFMCVIRIDDPIMYNIYTVAYVRGEIGLKSPSTMSLIIAASVWKRPIYLKMAMSTNNLDAVFAILVGMQNMMWSCMHDAVKMLVESGTYTRRILNAVFSNQIVMNRLRDSAIIDAVAYRHMPEVIKVCNEIVHGVHGEPTDDHSRLINNTISITDVLHIPDVEKYFWTTVLINSGIHRVFRHIFRTRQMILGKLYATQLSDGSGYFIPTVDDVVARYDAGLMKSEDVPTHLITQDMFELIVCALTSQKIIMCFEAGITPTRKSASILVRMIGYPLYKWARLRHTTLTPSQIEQIDELANCGAYCN